MPLTADPLTERRLQARTRLVVDVFEGESYGHDYGSYGHEKGDTLWWYTGGSIWTDDPLTIHDHILNEWDDERRTEDFVRGRYSPVNETISIIPIWDYDN